MFHYNKPQCDAMFSCSQGEKPRHIHTVPGKGPFSKKQRGTSPKNTIQIPPPWWIAVSVGLHTILTSSTKALQDTSHSPKPMADADQLLIQRPSPLAHTTSSIVRGPALLYWQSTDAWQAFHRERMGQTHPRKGKKDTTRLHFGEWRIMASQLLFLMAGKMELSAGILTHHVDAKVLEVNVLLRGERNEKLITMLVLSGRDQRHTGCLE